jgi:DeoR/GlpR family transcriptional regulator of sugar metabolism
MVRQLSFSERDSLRGDEKSAIAAEAVKLVEPGSALFVDTGTTALHFARVLPATLDLRVFTNNLRVAMDLFGRPGFEVIVYGGRLAGHSPDLVGEIALTRVQDFRLDLAILGADAVDPARGEIFASDIPTASLDRAVLRQAAKVAVLADSTKLRRQSLAAITQLTEGLTLVTDSGASPQDIEMLQATGAEITIAGAA